MNKKVMVLGGGIAGLTAAFYLSQENISVTLVEKSCFLGGVAIEFTCKATDKCQQCGACLVEEMLRDVTTNPDIKIYLNSEIERINKDKNFKIKLRKSRTTFEGNILKGFSKYNSPFHVVKKVTPDSPKGAVKIDDLGIDGEIQAEAIIIATGFTPFNPLLRPTYGYGIWGNIITGLELEHMLKTNKISRPSDGQEVKKIAFIQCVGSRSKEFNTLWCSEVCCPYALRMASLIKHKIPETDIWFFFIDVQNVGKDSSWFLKDIKSKINFINAIPIDIISNGQKARVIYKAEKEDRKYEEFDLVVLSVGITPNEDNKRIAQLTGIEIDETGFLKSKNIFDPSSTVKEGIFLAGTVTGPKNILDTISHAKSAVGETLTYLRRI